MSLKTYIQKRNFKNTPEPKVGKKSNASGLSFVIQRHDASHLHYDFRLELNGVLKSWAIPKGPSLNPADKRLAVMVEDHPLSYGKFEGEIPKGNYGAGTVEIWDNGTYEAEVQTPSPEKEIQKEIDNGSLKFVLHGKKLKGSFALVELKNSNGKNWLLIKHKDKYAITEEYNPDDGDTKNRKSGHSVKERSNGKCVKSTSGKAGKTSNKKDEVDKNDTEALVHNAQVVRSVRAGGDKVADFIKPMLAELDEKPFDNDGWVFEIKWDGYRAIAEITKGDLKFYSRNGLSFLNLYPSVANELRKIKKDVILDGEIVALDKDGKPSFQKLQNYGNNSSHSLVYYIFDCLSYNGKDLTNLSLIERKKILTKIIPKSEILRYSDHIEKSGKKFFEKVVKLGVEGMVAKLASSTYAKGKRSHDWLKIKNQNTQEAVIAGYTEPRGSRKYFGALLLGIYKKEKLTYIGHTGTGFTEKILKEVYEVLQPLVQRSSPFSQKIPVNSPVTWIKPEQVCAIKFSEVTDEGILRHPVFMGLRIDKKGKEVNTLDVAVTKTKSTAKTKVQYSLPKKNAKNSKKDGSTKDNSNIRVNGHTLHLTHQDKIYWPEEKITKGDVINYYKSVSDYILPHLKGRPQSLKRNPNGITDKGFFHKDAADAAPDWVSHIELYSEGAKKDIDYILCNNEATLLYLNNLGCIEINPWNSTVKNLDKPDYLIIDIDPSDKNTFDEVIEVALAVKDVADKAGASSYCKTSGATGMHVYLPLHAKYTYDQARSFAEMIALLVNQQLPKTTTVERSLNKRKGRIYIDYLQNKRGQTLSSVYSVRPVPGATVSTPLLWKEVKKGLRPSQFTIYTIGKRLEKMGDLFSGVLTETTDLKKCIKNLGG